jgi:hypothetical protein
VARKVSISVIGMPLEPPAPRGSMRHVGRDVMSGALVDGQRQRRLDFESIIPNEFTAQVPAGTSHATGTGWNRSRPWNMPEQEPAPTWPAGRSNRTGE